jgi:hypothetical protein
MIYASAGSAGHGKHEIEYSTPKKPQMRSISFFLLSKETYDAHKLLEVVWKHAGFLCERVEFHHSWVDPKTGQLSHNYRLYFQWGRLGDLDVDGRYLNQIVWRIERELEATGEFDMRGRNHDPYHDVNHRQGNDSL